jgi:hypothetical protein
VAFLSAFLHTFAYQPASQPAYLPTCLPAYLPAMPTKRKLDDITAELPSREALDARIQLLFPSSFPPQLQLPSGLDIDSPYALFSLFIGEDIFEFISQSTNEYAQRKQAASGRSSSEFSPGRAWKDTTIADIKVFFGILIYMGVHQSPRVDLYWRQDIQQGPLHSPRLYMSQKRFEQIKALSTHLSARYR